MMEERKVRADQDFSAFTSSAAPFDREYRELFSRYTEVTNGKELIAQSIDSLTAVTGRESLLDLGAGDGKLTSLLCKTFERIVAVDKKPEFGERLSLLPDVKFENSVIEQYYPTEKHNIILFCYSLSGLPEAEIEKTVTRLLEARSDAGKLLVVTYKDDCAWDQFSKAVSAHFGVTSFNAGTGIHTEQLEKVGFEVTELTSLRTDIWGQDLDELYDRLAFFFVRNVKEYFARQSELMPVLRQLSERIDSERISLPVTESILEVTRRYV